MKYTRPAAFCADRDYDAIEDALCGTAKGKRFLSAYLERNRRGETLSLLHAISRLHGVLIGERLSAGAQACRDVKGLVRDIARAKKVAAPLDQSAQLSHFRDLIDHVQAQAIAISEMLDEQGSATAASFALNGAGRDHASKLFGELVAMVGDDIDGAYDS
jgi:hypothetical protein